MLGRGRVWNNINFVLSQKYTHRQTRVNTRRAQTLQQSNTCSDSLTRCSEVTQMKFPPGSKFTGSDSFVFEYIFLQATHVFICFACQWTYQAIAIHNKGHTASEIGRPLKNLCYFHCLLSRTTCSIYKVSILFSPSLKQNLMYEPCSFKSVIL